MRVSKSKFDAVLMKLLKHKPMPRKSIITERPKPGKILNPIIKKNGRGKKQTVLLS